MRGFLELGHVVILEHLLRTSEAVSAEVEERLVQHYEVVAEALRGLRWVARGPFVGASRVHVVLLGLGLRSGPAAGPLDDKERYLRKLARLGRDRARVWLRPGQSREERAAALGAARDALVEGWIVALRADAPLPDDLGAALIGVRWEPLGPLLVATHHTETLLLPARVIELLAGRGLEGP